MSSSDVDRPTPLATSVHVTDDSLCVELSDGRSIAAPLDWYPRLSRAGKRERKNWRLSGRGLGIHWPDLDEDISVANLLSGKPSGESQASLARWLATRSKASKKRGKAPT
jgi:hypothetical protein